MKVVYTGNAEEKIKKYKRKQKIEKIITVISAILLIVSLLIFFVAKNNTLEFIGLSYICILAVLFFTKELYSIDEMSNTQYIELYTFLDNFKKNKIVIIEANDNLIKYYFSEDISKQIYRLYLPYNLFKQEYLPEFLNEKYRKEEELNFDDFICYINRWR